MNYGNTDRLGIFYSNNNNPVLYPCILKSLETISVASKNKADIITNVWNSFGNKNPFIETIAWTKSSSHLNQILQILQCLFKAKTVGNYRYVSFLEHDVLYPEGYFDYPSFDNELICNSNYIGLNKQGFQALQQHDKPLSQITMSFDFSIQHFLHILENALLQNNGNVDRFKCDVPNWESKNPAVHLNHGHNFTSHFNCYSNINISTHNGYWGESSQYSLLFP